ncbi:MAG: hypothetical protein QM610_12895, partial [Chitinophagaceae bacterium]
QPSEMFRSVNTTGAQRSPFADLTFLPLFLSRKKVGHNIGGDDLDAFALPWRETTVWRRKHFNSILMTS